MTIDPKQDGILHINIYSKGETYLGEMLSNFYFCPITTIDGSFNSVEAYWYWLSIECPRNEKEILRNTYGYNAKKTGTALLKEYPKITDDNFQEKITKAIWRKVKKNEPLFDDKYKDLPYEHYYKYGDKVIDVKDKHLWMIQAIEKMSKYIYENK